MTKDNKSSKAKLKKSKSRKEKTKKREEKTNKRKAQKRKSKNEESRKEKKQRKSKKGTGKKRKSEKRKSKKRKSKERKSKKDKIGRGKHKQGKSAEVKSANGRNSRGKSVQAFTPGDLEFYQRVLERNQQMMLEHQDVVAFGIGYGRKNGEWTEEISVVVEVSEKSPSVADERRIPLAIDGLPTDVVEFEAPVFDDPAATKEIVEIDQACQPFPAGVAQQPQLRSRGTSDEMVIRTEFLSSIPDHSGRGRNPDWRQRGLPRLENIEFNPLLGGIPIRNPDISKINACVLGAIVYDAVTGVAHGLSVRHGIGDQANANAPIHQPMNQDPKYKIGTLVKTDADLDAALFRIDTDRMVVPKVKGELEDFEPGEPIEPVEGMTVECFGRRNYAKGKVMYVSRFYSQTHRKWMRNVHVRLESGYVTQGGDSGSVWFESKSKSPIGLHRGSARGDQTHDIATCMMDLANAWGFRFSPLPKTKRLEVQLNEFETCFVERADGLLALCHRAGEQVRFKQFGQDCAKKSDVTGSLTPMSGLAAAELRFKNAEEPNSTFVFWRTNNNYIQRGKLDASGNKLTDIPNRPFGLRTLHKPAATSFQSQVLLAFTDANSGAITIVGSADGRRWFYRLKSSQKSIAAPALVEFKGKLFISWVAPGNSHSMIANSFGQVKIAELKTHNNSLKFGDVKNVTQSNSSKLDPALVAGNNQLFLAYTNATNQIDILKGDSAFSLTPHDQVDSISAASPSLFFFEGELICSRREGVIPFTNNIWW